MHFLATLLYIHGFLSSPLSYKAQQVKTWLAEQRPDIDYICPQLSPYPDEVRETLDAIVAGAEGPVYLMGSSLGGYLCSYLAEKYDLPAVLINPSVRPYEMMPDYLDQPLHNYHTEDVYTLTEQHVVEVKAMDTPKIGRAENYWLLLQTGDETLDYRQAVEKYSASEQLIEEGGDHSFQNFERHIEAAIGFLQAHK